MGEEDGKEKGLRRRKEQMDKEERDRERERVRRREQMGEEERERGRERVKRRESSSYYKWQSPPGAMIRVCQHRQALRFPQLLSQWEGQPATTW